MYTIRELFADLAYTLEKAAADFVPEQLGELRDGCDGEGCLWEVCG